MFPVLAATVPTYIHVLAALFVAVTLFLILVILVQRPKGGGLSAAFGGGAGSGSSQALVGGAGIGNMLTMATIVAFALFLGLAMGLIWAARASHNAEPKTEAPAKVEAPATPATTPSPAAPAPVKPAAPAPAAPAAPAPAAP